MEMLYLYLGAYILILLGISVWLAKKNTDEDFLIAGRDRKSLQIMASKFANSVGASWFITYTGYTYLYGFSVLSILPGIVISYLLFAYWAVPRLYEDSQCDKFYTQGDFVYSKTGNIFDKKLIDISGILISSIWLLVAIIGGAKVISFLNILSYEGALLTTSGIILVYLLLSGFKAVIITDVIQTIIVLVLFGFIISALFQSNSISQVLAEKTGTMSTATVIGFFIYGLFSIFSIADRYQLTFSAASASEAKKGMALSVIPIVIMIFLLLAIGLSVHGIDAGLDPDIVFIKLFFDYLPEMFISIGALLFLAGLMSSADSRVYNITSYIAFLNNKEGDKVKLIRWLTLLLIILVTATAYFIRDIVDATIFAAGTSLIPSVAMIYVIAGGVNSKKFCALLLGGFIGLVLGITFVGLEPSVAVFPIVFSLFGFLADSKLFSRKKY